MLFIYLMMYYIKMHILAQWPIRFGQSLPSISSLPVSAESAEPFGPVILAGSNLLCPTSGRVLFSIPHQKEQ